MAVRFMVDSTEGKDGHCETIMDYVVSWTLRRAQNECSSETGKERLYMYSRRLLGLIIQQKIKPEDDVVVETWKQEALIDLWVRATINGVSHDVLIENKYYSHLHDDQLNRYKIYFDNYLDEHFKESKRHYVILSCKESWENEEYKGYGYEVYGWDDMTYAMFGDNKIIESSGSDIFDEFWINWT